MKLLAITGVVIGALLVCAGIVAAQTSLMLPTVVSSGTIPGNGDVNEDGKVTVTDAQLILQTVKYGKPTFSVRGFQQGDANLNGRLDNEDARLINKHVVALIRLPIKAFKRGDADGNGYVGTVDSLYVLKYLDNDLSVMPYVSAYNMDINQDYQIDGRDSDCIMKTNALLPCD